MDQMAVLCNATVMDKQDFFISSSRIENLNSKGEKYNLATSVNIFYIAHFEVNTQEAILLSPMQ